MARGRNTTTVKSSITPSRRSETHLAAPADYEDFRRQHLQVMYLEDDRSIRQAVQHVKKLDPSLLSLDLETASKAGRFGSWNGSIRTIQLALDEPDRDIEPLQILIDTHKCDAKPFLPMLRTRNIEKQIHYMKFEEEWAILHLGNSIGQIYDTWAASRSIQKRLREIQDEEGLKAAQKIDPDWKPRRDASKDSPEDKRLREVMHKEGLKAAQAIVPGWQPHGNTLAELTSRYLGITLPKENQASDWAQPQLNGEQIVYAAMDVAILPPLVREVKSTAAKLGVEDKIDYQISKLKEEVKATTEKAKRTKQGDDSRRLGKAMRRAKTKHELQRIFESGRQMTILAENQADINNLYAEIKRELPN